jgi:hypothetical protein
MADGAWRISLLSASEYRMLLMALNQSLHNNVIMSLYQSTTFVRRVEISSIADICHPHARHDADVRIPHASPNATWRRLRRGFRALGLALPPYSQNSHDSCYAKPCHYPTTSITFGDFAPLGEGAAHGTHCRLLEYLE